MHFHVCCKRLYALEISQGKAFINYLLLVHLFALKGLALPTLQNISFLCCIFGKKTMMQNMN
ncbi:hypothetical protein NIES2098_39250 [Calothrix sp. NIES-2098]|nr:hypothetical protein NIES2098_39250 [Calothrix sp. NIES-2098]